MGNDKINARIFPWHRLSIRTKLFLVMLITTSMVSAIGAYIIISKAAEGEFLKLRESLISTARTGAVTINGDKHRLLELDGREKLPHYLDIKKRLAQIKQANPNVRYAYTMTKTSNPDILKFIVDAETDPKLVSHLGDPFDISEFPEMKTAFKEPSADKELTTDKWGTWLSGYAPIRDSKGIVVAILGLDLPAKDVELAVSEYRKNMMPSLILFLLAPPIISLFISMRISKSLIDTVDTAKKIANGDYNLRVAVRTSDELGQLANAINYMASIMSRCASDAADKTMIDNLTGLYNYRYFYKRFSDEILRARKYDHPLTLLVIDIDDFSRFNKANGYDLGDIALQEIAAILKQYVGSLGIISRYSGEEFVIILPETNEEEAIRIAKYVSKTVKSHDFTVKDASSGSLTVSNGIASCSEQTNNAEELIALAFIGLEETKHLMVNQTSSFKENADKRDTESSQGEDEDGAQIA